MAAAAQQARTVDYVPRPQLVAFHARDKRWSVLVAHRRFGKTVGTVMDMVTCAISCKKQEGRYAYIAPYREQAKIVAWNYLKRYSEPVVTDPINDFRESELAVRYPNGAQVRLFGADNPNALRGMYLDGVVMDEYADMRPSLWGEVIRPLLSDRKGWAVFIGTPKGKNSFWRIYDEAGRDPSWFRLMLKASETGILSATELADARKTMTQSQYDQEFECSFEAAIIGAIYANELHTARERITTVPYDPSLLVHTAWDIGYGDSTAIWFWQVSYGSVRIIDCYEAAGEQIPFYLSMLKSKPYLYDTAWLPHDAENGSLTGLSVAELMRSNGVKCEVLPRMSLEEGINAARMVLPMCSFDASKCERGLEALRSYHWAYNDKMGELKPTPVHDWSSHFADAFRYLAQAYRSAKGTATGEGLKLPPMDWKWKP